MIRIDSREQNKDILKLADERKLLRYDGPDGQPYSYDAEIVTKSGQTIRVEMKHSWQDAYTSWREREGEHSRLWRQTRVVDLLLVVWDDMAVAMQSEPAQAAAIKGFKNRLQRMNAESDPPVCIFSSVADEIAFILFLESQKHPIPIGRRATEPAATSPAAGSTPAHPAGSTTG